jgi:hypothetical protein
MSKKVIMRYFTAKELVDKETYDRLGEKALSLFNPEALVALDDLREFMGVPITVNDWANGGNMQWRGWRTKEKAKQLGAPNSQHALGNAFDCTIQGMTAKEARFKIMTHKDHELLYRITRMEDGVSWLHWDCAILPKGKSRIYLFHA